MEVYKDEFTQNTQAAESVMPNIRYNIAYNSETNMWNFVLDVWTIN